MKTNVVNTLTLDNFAFVAGCGVYSLATASGNVTIEMTRKQSNFGKGELTVYDCKVTAIDGTTTEYKEKPIGYYKKLFGAVVNHREGSNATASKVRTEAEITEATAKYLSNLNNLVERASRLFDLAGVSYEPSFDIPTIVAAYRAKLEAANEAAKIEAEAAKKAAAERKEKAERKDIAKAVLNASDIQKAIIEATMAGDFAKVAELTASLASA